MSKEKTEVSDLKEAVYELTGDLNQLVSREHHKLQDELGQVSMLVSDAVKTLGESFSDLNEQVAEQASLVELIVAEVLESQVSGSKGEEAEKLDKVSKLSQQINRNVAVAIRSLQFDDIVQQLVTHSHNRTEKMEQLFVSLSRKLFELKDLDPQDSMQIADYIEAMQKEITHFRITLEKANPVRQTSMGVGKTELF